MAYTDREYDITELAKFNGINGSLDIAPFAKIQETLSNEMRKIYGNDIDLSTATADGQYLMSEVLLISNTYEVLNQLYTNLNPNSASGKYLDILCSLSGISRKQAENSTMQVTIKNVGANDWSEPSISIIDENGYEWKFTNPLLLNGDFQYKISSNSSMVLVFVCQENGSIYVEANANLTIAEANLSIISNEASELGFNEETDEELRNRLINRQTLSNNTVLEGLIGSLYMINGVKDVYIKSYAPSPNNEASDGTTLIAGSVYIVIRYNFDINETDKLNSIKPIIAETIYNKLTPGIYTIQTADSQGMQANYDYLEFGGTTTLYWKIANPLPILPISITCNINEDLYESDDKYKEIIKNIVFNYFNNLKLTAEPQKGEIISEIINKANQDSSIPVIFPYEVTFVDGTEKLNGYLYNDDNCEISVSGSGSSRTFTISAIL